MCCPPGSGQIARLVLILSNSLPDGLASLVSLKSVIYTPSLAFVICRILAVLLLSSSLSVCYTVLVVRD